MKIQGTEWHLGFSFFRGENIFLLALDIFVNRFCGVLASAHC